MQFDFVLQQLKSFAGKTLEDVADEPVAKKLHVQAGSPLPLRQGVYINEQGKQVFTLNQEWIIINNVHFGGGLGYIKSFYQMKIGPFE